MKEIQVTTTITVKEDGEITAEVKQAAGAPDNETIRPDNGKMTESEAEREAVASDLANVCEYLEDSEVIKIRLIVSRAQARKDEEEGGGGND